MKTQIMFAGIENKCPLCQSYNTYVSYFEHPDNMELDGYRVLCGNCQASGPISGKQNYGTCGPSNGSQEHAIRLWNKGAFGEISQN